VSEYVRVEEIPRIAGKERKDVESYKYLIIGGGLAGGRAVGGIRDLDEEGTVAVVTQEPHRPYERPPLSKKYLRGEVGTGRVYVEDADYYDEHDVELLTEVRATALDPKRKVVTLEDGRELEYEKLLLATGGHAWRLPLPGNELEKVFALRTIEDSEAIRRAGGEGKHALIMGGSFIGSEVAASLRQLGTQVTMIFPESRLLERIVPVAVSDFLFTTYRDEGIEVLPGTVAEELKGDGEVERATLDNGETLEVDLVVMGVGIRLNTELAEEAELELNERGAVLVDEQLRTSDRDIYAAGDIAAWPDPTFGERLRVEHWDVARRQGRRAGRNMAGEGERYTALPYFYSDLFDLSFEVWGNLTSWEQTVFRGSLEEGSLGIYYFDEGRMVGVLSMGRPSGERSPMQDLVRARPKRDEVAEQLRDEGVDLGTLVGGEEEGPEMEGPALSFEEDIRPLFREKDIEEMKEIADFDLSDYEAVRENAESIHARLDDGTMPCDGPWPDEDIETFRRWIDQGMEE
jgi:NADPH-dependent 2,4-dienoyl-CoA reductase/sulfur reductase-like enzyme